MVNQKGLITSEKIHHWLETNMDNYLTKKCDTAKLNLLTNSVAMVKTDVFQKKIELWAR